MAVLGIHVVDYIEYTPAICPPLLSEVCITISATGFVCYQMWFKALQQPWLPCLHTSLTMPVQIPAV